ncbi:ArsB/NhaD family transporter [Roseomonas marmotae]|uniref:Transporter n=1 Tax=Roseomonas marmotae TaxID=2768161 RepID=A0ABS3KEU1_9PROT|nr:SLC13 family permease [Roseomonas marmotae]MBO1075527.1 transporter [Roseomonas marmotae]QTI81520.1 transporter [Roseomonas marmotae]
MELTLAIFFLVYVAMGVGHLPGFRLHRTGAALVGAMLLIALGRISPAAAWGAIDYNVIGLLFGLMIVSSAFGVAGFYDWTARKVGAVKVGPKALLAIFIAVSGILSAVLTNDVVSAAMTGVLCAICLARRLNPIPFLLGFCFAANVGSAATLIGSPKSMIVAETLEVSFTGFTALTAPPSILGLVLAWLVLVIIYRGKWSLPAAPPKAAVDTAVVPVALDRTETIKAAIVVAAVIMAFVFTDWPRMLIALLAASFLLVSRRVDSDKVLGAVDGSLLLLLIGLFIVNAALGATGLPEKLVNWVASAGLDLHDPVAVLVVIAVLCNIVGATPAVMLALPFLSGGENPELLGAAVALGASFSANALLFGSLAGIIVAEEGRRRGVIIGFGEFTRAGALLAFLCLLLAAGWLHYLR